MVRVDERNATGKPIENYGAITFGHRLILPVAVASCLILAACAKEKPQAQPEQQHLNPQPLPHVQAPPSDPPSPPRGYLMQRDLPPPKPHYAPQQEQPQGPKYDPRRLKDAAEIKSWSNVTVETKGVDCWLKTCWKNGQMSVRLAMLGSGEGLQMFVSGVKMFRVRFCDATGAEVNEYTVAPEDLTWAPPSVNGGMPTLQFESSINVSLEEYEQYRQWQLFWDEQ